jgi:hypothetical protein
MLQNITPKILGIVGLIVGIGIVIIQTKQVEVAQNQLTISEQTSRLIAHQTQTIEKLTGLVDALFHKQEELQQSLYDLQRRVNDLEGRFPRKNNFQKTNYVVHRVADTRPSLPSINTIGSSSDAHNPYLREYVMSGIYILLALVLVAAALVSIFSKTPSRTAVETTKTLLAFFIGATTGHAS